MKKSGFYRSMAAAAVAVLTLGGLSFVSCDTFDDTELRNSIDELNSRVETLEATVNGLQGDVDAINALLEGGKVIKSITPNEDGTAYTIAYVGDDTTPDVITVGTTGQALVTVIEDNGKRYWGVIGEDGQPHHILGSDNPLEIGAAEAPRLRIDEATGKLQVSVDGGSEWTDTGVAVADFDIPVPTFSSVEPDTDKGIVTFTLAGGTSFVVPMTTELTCEFLSGMTIFEEGETKRLVVNAGGFDKYELAVPQGWTAEFDGIAVSLTAPDQWVENYETAGEVILRVYNSAAKEVLMDRISVKLGGVQMISVGTEVVEGAVNIVVTPMWGMDMHLGVMPASEFSVSAAAKAAGKETLIDAESFEYDAETSAYIYRVPFTDYIENPIEGEAYVIWFAQDSYNADVAAEDIMTVICYYGADVTLSVGETATFNNIDIKITPSASTEYYYGICLSDQYYAEAYLSMINRGSLKSHTGAIDSDLQTIISVNTDGDDSNDDSALIYSVDPGATYTLWALVKTAVADYSVADFKTVEFTMADLQNGGSAEVTFGDVAATTTSIEVPYTRPDNAYQVYLAFISDAEYSNYGSDDAVRTMMLNGTPYSEILTAYTNYNLSPNTSGYLCGVVVDNNGLIGPLTKIKAGTTDVEHDSTIGITSGTVTPGTTSVSVPVTITGSPDKLIYYCKTKSEFEAHYQFHGDEKAVLSQMGLSPSSYLWTSVAVSSLSNNTLEIRGLSFAEDYVLIATVVGASGHTSAESISIEFKTETPVIIESTATGYNDAVPEVTEIAYEQNDWGGYYASTTVTPKNASLTWYYYFSDAEYESTLELVSAIMSNGNTRTGTQTIRSSIYYDTTCYVLWIAEDGTIYEPVKLAVTYPVE